MQGIEHRINLTDLRIRDKISAVHIIFISCPFYKYRVKIFKQILLKPSVILHGNTAEARLHITVMCHLMQIYLKRTEWLQHIQLFFQVIQFLF